MAVQTPIAGTFFFNIDGNQREVCAKFASVADTDTYVTGLKQISSFQVTSGGPSGTAKVIGGTVSGGTITFQVESGPDTNTFLRAQGW